MGGPGIAYWYFLKQEHSIHLEKRNELSGFKIAVAILA